MLSGTGRLVIKDIIMMGAAMVTMAGESWRPGVIFPKDDASPLLGEDGHLLGTPRKSAESLWTSAS